MKGEIKGCFFVVQHQHQHRENWKITYLYASIKTNKQWPSWWVRKWKQCDLKKVKFKKS